MRIIPRKTKVSTEFFKGVSLADILVGFFGVLVIFFVFLSSLPGRLWIDLGLIFFFGLLLVRIEEEPNYMFLIRILRHMSYVRRYRKIPDVSNAQREADPMAGMGKKEKKAYLKRKRKQAKRDKKRAALQAEEDGQQEQTPDMAHKEDGQEPSSLERPETEGTEGANTPRKLTGKEKRAAKKVAKKTAKKAASERPETEGAEEGDAPQKLTKKEEKAAKKAAKRAEKQKQRAKKAEDKFLKSKKVSEEEKAPIRERRQREAEERYYKAKVAEQEQKRVDIQKLYLVSDISGGYIWYGGQYFGAAIEIPAVEFRFFSEHRQNAAIDRALGGVIRSVGAKYAANLVKIERPMVLDDHIEAEYDKVEALKRSFERGVFSEEELKARVEVVYDRINALRRRNREEKVLVPHFYLVLFDSDKRQLDNQVRTAMSSLSQGDMAPHRLDDKELAVFLRYVNSADFDEREIDDIDPADYAMFTLPDSVEIKQRTVEVNSIVTHNFRVLNYPLSVGNAWGAAMFDMPGTKVVMKFSQMDREKSIRAIDRSISELNSQLDKTGVSSRVLELQTHIETLSELLVMLQNNNENLMSMNMYITGYDIVSTRENKLLVPQPPPSVLPRISGMKKDIKRAFSERGFKLGDLSFQQFEAFVATQVNGYDPFAKKARGVPSSTVAAVFPWIYASLNDDKGLNLGTSDGVPTFLNFFRRDSERVNSNMVIVGKSGGGKSYATKSILTNLAADDSKIFVLDPENEYTELAANLNGKFINVANSSHGRINPFHIITSLEDDEAEEGQETSSYAAHLQFLEEFFRQILPEIDGDAMEYLNNLINRVYSRRSIDQYTNLNTLRPEDYPIFDDLYDCILEEFQRTKSDYLKSNLRVLMNYVAKFSTGGRNANIWNGPSTLSTVENFIVFNFQSLLANRNNTVANAQMLLVLKYLDNEIIKNREYNMKFGANRKIVVVIDEAHVFIDAKYPLALDFMFQLAKRIRKYNGMQIVITQNIKDFVGSEELARKSTAIINACQYSFIFSLAPNDMHDLCTLYEKAGGINESEQEQIISAGRGQAFVVTSPTSRASMQVETPKPVEEMFSNPMYATHYFAGDEGAQVWEDFVARSRQLRQKQADQLAESAGPVTQENLPDFRDSSVSLIEMDEGEEEILLMGEEEPVAATLPKHMKYQAEGEETQEGPFTPEALQRYGFEALVGEIRRTVRQELENELKITERRPAGDLNAAQIGEPEPWPQAGDAAPQTDQASALWWDLEDSTVQAEPAADAIGFEPLPVQGGKDMFDDLFATEAPPPQGEASFFDDWFASAGQPEAEAPVDDLFAGLFSAEQPDVPPEAEAEPEKRTPAPEPKPEPESEPEELPLVYEVTLEQLMAMA